MGGGNRNTNSRSLSATKWLKRSAMRHLVSRKRIAWKRG